MCLSANEPLNFSTHNAAPCQCFSRHYAANPVSQSASQAVLLERRFIPSRTHVCMSPWSSSSSSVASTHHVTVPTTIIFWDPIYKRLWLILIPPQPYPHCWMDGALNLTPFQSHPRRLSISGEEQQTRQITSHLLLPIPTRLYIPTDC